MDDYLLQSKLVRQLSPLVGSHSTLVNLSSPPLSDYLRLLPLEYAPVPPAWAHGEVFIIFYNIDVDGNPHTIIHGCYFIATY
jgi:hypothetical protein